MSDQSNIPMTTDGPEPFYQVWIKALTRPKEQTFADLAASPNAKASTAYLWVFLSSLVASIFSLIVQGAALRDQFAQSGVGGDQLGGGIGGVVITLLCGAPILAILGTIFFAIAVAIIQWIAKMFGGKGTNDQLAYAFAAFGAPYSLISGVFILLSAIPYVGFCFQLILSLAGFYILFLQILAVKSINQFGWGPALGSVFIPSLVVVFICGCLLLGGFFLMGPAIGDVLSGINQSLQNAP